MGRKKNFEREDVLNKALGLFWKKGFADTSVQDLEKATGVNKSGLYSEFKDKEDLYLCTLNQYFAQSPAQELLLKEPLGWSNIETFLRLQLECGELKGCFGTNSLREVKILPPPVKRTLSTNFAGLKELLVKNLRGHTDAAPEVVAELILSFQHGVALEQNLQTAENLEERIKLFFSALRKM